MLYRVCATILRLMPGMMLADDPDRLAFVDDIMGTINLILTPIFGLAAALGGIYAVFLGVKMARADSAEAREEAKKRVIYCVIGMAVAIGLILLLQLFVNNLSTWIGGGVAMPGEETPAAPGETLAA